MQIDVKHNFEEIKEKLSWVNEKKWPKILSYATTETAFYVRNKLRKEMPSYIDRPKPYTLNSIYVKRGNVRDAESSVQWRKPSGEGNSGGRYLMPLVEGGERETKRFEMLFIRKGLMPAGYRLVPTKDAPKDVYGNVPGAYLTRVLSFLRSLRDPLQNRTNNKKKLSKKKLEWFIISPKVANKANLSPGIYERISLFGGAIRKVFSIVPATKYSKQFPFYQIGLKASSEMFPSKMDEAIKKIEAGEKGW